MYRLQNHQFDPRPPKRTRLRNYIQTPCKSSFFCVSSQFLQEFNSVATQQQQQRTPAEDSVCLDFGHAKLKLRHDSALGALYSDLQRQCKTCGMRFKSQEKHRDHMDWHVRKNRDAKRKRSRNYFLSSSFWLLGSAAPAAFLAADHAVEDQKNPDELFAVPADENQEECPLCMEGFDVYMSDDTNDWMCRGTVYLSEAKASSRKFYKSLLGHIVHAKCIGV